MIKDTLLMPTKVNIRPAKDSDYDWLYTLNQEVYQSLIMLEFGYWDDEEEQSLFVQSWQSHNIQIITVEEKPVGMFRLDEHMDHLWLAEIQILPCYQNQGIGCQIIKQLKIRSNQLRIPLRLRVLHANIRAYRLYQRLGFKRVNSAKHYHVMEA